MAVTRTPTVNAYQLRADLIQIQSEWRDPGQSTSGSKVVTCRVQQVQVDIQGRQVGDISYKEPLQYDMTDVSNLTKTMTITDPVTNQSITISVAGVAQAIEAWVTARIDESFPA